MKTIYIHIGFPKTGTKYLSRRFFSRNPKIENFGKQQSLQDIDPDLLSSFNKIIQKKKIGFEDEKKIMKSITKINLKNNKINLISYEGFTQLNFSVSHIEIFKRLKSFFLRCGIKIKIFATIRSQIEMIPSHFANAPKLYSNLPTKGFKEFIKQLEQKNKKTSQVISTVFDRYKYYRLYSKLIKLFGKKNIKFLFFEEMRDDKKSFFKELNNFLKLGKFNNNIINADAENVTRKKNNKYLRINKYLIKKLNKSIIFKIFLIPFSSSIKKKLYNYTANIIIDTIYFFDPIELNDDQISTIKKYYHKDNSKLINVLKKNKIRSNYM